MEIDVTPATTGLTGAGTYDDPFVLTGSFTRIGVAGPVHVRLQDVVIEGSGSNGLLVDAGATVTADNLTVSGTWDYGVLVNDMSRLRLSGTVDISGYAFDGLAVFRGSDVAFPAACDLSITGDRNGYGIHLFAHSRLINYTAGVNISLSENYIAFQLGLSGLFQHRGASGSIVCSNQSSPLDSAVVQGTDQSSFSTNQPFSADHFVWAFDLNSISYAETTGARTLTNVSNLSRTSQNSVFAG